MRCLRAFGQKYGVTKEDVNMGFPGMEAKKTSMVVVVILLLSAFYLTLAILPVNVVASTLYVGGTGPGNYTKIQLAVDASNPGDTVYVYSGTYNEDISINKPLRLVGENKDATIIRGSGTTDTLLVLSDGVNVTGFSVENSGSTLGSSGIRLFFVQNCHLINNFAYGHERGISFWGAFNNVAEDNNMSNNKNGVYLWATLSHSNLVVNNILWSNTAGIYLDESHNNTLTGNTIVDNDYGIYLLHSSHNTMHSNLMIENGIFIDGQSLAYWNTHTISSSNTVNGRPVQYRKDSAGGSIPLGAGQVILTNCNNMAINNQNLSTGSVGVAIVFSSHISITNRTSSSNFRDGIYVYDSNNITIADSNTSNNGNDGIFMDHVSTSVLWNNVAYSNGMNGIHVFAGDLNTIDQNGIFLNGPLGPGSHIEHCAIYLSHINHSVISGNNVHSNSNCAFSLIDSNTNSIHSNSFSNNANGVFVGGADGNTFTNNTISDNVIVGVSLEASSHNIFSDNTVTHHLYGMGLGESNDNTLAGNYISSHDARDTRSGIILWASSSHVLADNVMDGDGLIIEGGTLQYWNTHSIDTSNTVNGRPVYYWKNVTGGTVPPGASEVILANCSNIVVENQNLDDGTAGIEVGFSSNNTITGNSANFSKKGIYLLRSDDNTIFNNAVSFSNSRGIHLIASNRNTISNSKLWSNKYGITLLNSDNNSITDNDVWESTWDGISISHSGSIVSGSFYGSFNNTIVNNTVFNNREGLSILGSSNNTVTFNSVVNNMNGVTVEYFDFGGTPIEYSRNNKIHHNNIIDNAEQAYDNQGTNQWDDGYPSGGNYWSDYTGADIFSGPNQDIPGSDFIGDTPYVIDFDSEDRYPLMNPFVTFPLVPSAPRDLHAVPGDQQTTLDWIAPSFDGSSPVTNYRIYRGTTSGGEVLYTQIGNVLTFPDMGLTNGQMFCYRVSAVNGVGEGPMSNEACATPTTTPGAPLILKADLSGDRLENVTVKWSPSSDDGVGQNSVVGYSIFRSNVYDVNALGYQLIASVPNRTIEFNDELTGEGDPNDYFYRICAVDLNNLINCSANQAGKFTRSLSNGPNIVSIPLIQSDKNIETVLQTVNWDKAWTYDSSSQKWKSHMTFKPYKGELFELNISRGIWVNVTVQSNLTVAGIVPSNTSIHLHAGWNLVGFPSFSSTYAVSDLKATVGVEEMEGFDASNSPYLLRSMTNGDVLQTGYGYWIKVTSDVLWAVPNS